MFTASLGEDADMVKMDGVAVFELKSSGASRPDISPNIFRFLEKESKESSRIFLSGPDIPQMTRFAGATDIPSQ